MLDTHAWEQLEGLMFVARRLVEGLFAGRHASPRSGIGQDFFDYRVYAPGDDPRRVDWKLFGRSDRLYIRRHRRLTELDLYLLVDASASMNFADPPSSSSSSSSSSTADKPITKWSHAQQLAAAIAYLAIRQGDRAGVGVFDDSLHAHIPPAGGRTHLMQLVHMLEKSKPDRGTGDIRLAVRSAHASMKRRGLFVICSDLLDPPADLFDALDLLRHDGFEAIVLQVLTPGELTLVGMNDGPRRWVDPETAVAVRAEAGAVQAGYQANINAHIEQVRRGCWARAVDHALIRTDEPIVGALRQYLAKRSSAV